jgi:zinc D-Ala-D-Ala dipeptidase
LILIPFVLINCSERQEPGIFQARAKLPETKKAILVTTARDSSEYEKLFVRNGLVNINEFDPDIRVVLLYNTDKNFLGKSFYKGLDQCYLHCEVATKLNHAQKYLKQHYPFYNLIVFDAARPSHIQKMLWDSLKMKPTDKYNYVARPDEFSMHNFGAAVDVGIINENGVLLDMGTPFDFFGELAQPKLESELFANGKLSRDAYKNRLILRDIMKKAGFSPITSEWWHFNACTKAYAAENFPLIP